MLEEVMTNNDSLDEKPKSNYFYTAEIDGVKTKFRLVWRGINPAGEDWYDVECKDVDVPNSKWEGGLCGTEEFLSGLGLMTNLDKEWAKKNAGIK